MLTLPLLLLACHDVERAGVQYAEAPEPTVPEVLSLIDRANRVSMMLRGVRPTPEESARIAGEPAALAELAETWSRDPRFGDTVRDLHADVLALRVDSHGQWPAVGPMEGEDQEAMARSRSESALRLVEHVVTSDRPYTEILTADYTLADRYVAGMEGLPFDDSGPEWQVTTYIDGRPMAGVLSNTGLWQRWWSNSTGQHRNRANFLSLALLCDEIGSLDMPVFPNVTEGDEGVGADSLREDPACVVCHTNLDPLASHLWGFELIVPGNRIAEGCADGEGPCYPLAYWSDARAQRYRRYDLPSPGFYGQESRDLTSLGELVTTDDRFAGCVVENAWTYLTQRPAEELPTGLAERLADGFVRDDYDYRSLLVELVTSDAVADASAPPAQVRPEVYDRLLHDLVGGSWWMTVGTGDVPVLLSSRVGLRDLAGGMDHAKVLTPNHQPSPTAMLAFDAAAEVAARTAVAEGVVEPAIVQRDLVTQQVMSLASRATGRPLTVDDDLVVDLVELFYAALEALDDPAEAWVVTVRALLASPDTLTY